MFLPWTVAGVNGVVIIKAGREGKKGSKAGFGGWPTSDQAQSWAMGGSAHFFINIIQLETGLEKSHILRWGIGRRSTCGVVGDVGGGGEHSTKKKKLVGGRGGDDMNQERGQRGIFSAVGVCVSVCGVNLREKAN